MIHQPSIHRNGEQGQATDIKIVSDQLQKSKLRLNRILAENTGRTIEEVVMATERYNFLSAGEALDFGLSGGWVRIYRSVYDGRRLSE